MWLYGVAFYRLIGSLRLMKTSLRSQKFARIVQESILPIIQQYLGVDEVGFLTVEEVEVSGDLEYVLVYVKSINAPKDWLVKLEKLTSAFEYELGKKFPQKRRKFNVRFKGVGGD